MHATMIGVPSSQQGNLIHQFIRGYNAIHPDGEQPADPSKVAAYLDSLEFHARHEPNISDVRRARLIHTVEMARNDIENGDIPTRATLEAWLSLPASAHVDTSSRGSGTPPYHRRFSNFDSRTVEATDRLFASRPSRISHEERDVVFRRWIAEVSDVYGMEPPSFSWDEDAADAGGGYYRPSDHSITMSRAHPSITTLIHEFRHALQAKGSGAKQIDPDVEVDARAWSLSLYHKVRPVLFERMVRQGLIFHITADDLDR